MTQLLISVTITYSHSMCASKFGDTVISLNTELAEYARRKSNSFVTEQSITIVIHCTLIHTKND